ncbi:alcohol dehydrogenase catalytic domain-containing protein [Algoriphagus sp. C2-6-M1]|uniref:alcohol dehydrogenase catalytic domain-containing protein n=1 Tax=Algoriphagus persicinus TaxID=3108754 RepID=UPI002B3DEB18|nr:alcohol dehydrogenase catalytic domain-containing protein [Algoriphagus sp. C2-6-M1]MEB2780033.1 alcohol dehydrogenase catalytic domain-containing protein [Algoriphagus sp. C2-6-M1]
MKVSAYASYGPYEKLKPFSYEMGELSSEQVEIRVINCGICHSDLSMMNNDWGMTAYPIVPGHEIIGEVKARFRIILKNQLEMN